MTVKTNYREISRAIWEDTFSTALVATLSNFKNLAGTCIVGSSEPYDSLVIPWGSSPITDHLLSSDEFVVMHDGASHSRTDKVKDISQWKAGMNNLRVCWEGELKDRNCGTCEKCIRTKLNFLAVGVSIPPCFPASDILEDMKNIKIRNDAVRAEWRQIYEYGITIQSSAPWLEKMKSMIDDDQPGLVSSGEKRLPASGGTLTAEPMIEAGHPHPLSKHTEYAEFQQILETENAELRAELETIKFQLTHILGSRSWRLTSSLRWIKRSMLSLFRNDSPSTDQN